MSSWRVAARWPSSGRGQGGHDLRRGVPCDMARDRHLAHIAQHDAARGRPLRLYYPAPYAHEAPRKLPVVVVDQDASALSRAMIRDLDATRAIHVLAVADDLSAARADMRSGKVDGIILISDGLERQLQAGTAGSGIAVWVNATYLLRASTIGEAATAVVQDIAKTRLLPGGQFGRTGPPVTVVEEPLFNRTGGYKGYVFPRWPSSSSSRRCCSARRPSWAAGGGRAAGVWDARNMAARLPPSPRSACSAATSCSA